MAAGEGRQRLVKAPSTAARLRVLLHQLQRQRKVLAATAAVMGLA